MKKTNLIVSVGIQNFQDTGIRGSFGHQPTLGDYGSKKIYLNNKHIFTKILGKEINKYSGNYNSYTKADIDNDHKRIINVIVDTIHSIERDLKLSLVKNKVELAEKIFNDAYYDENTSIVTNIRKNKEYLGVKLLFKGDFYL